MRRRSAARRRGHAGMTCREMVALLSDYVDGGVGRALRRTVEDHGGECPPCRVFVSTLQATVRAVRSLPREPLSARRRAALVAALRAARGL